MDYSGASGICQEGIEKKDVYKRQTLVGHAVGGVCPFAVNEGVEIYLDESLRRFATIFPAAGSSNSAIELSCDELETYSGGTWVDVCKAWRPDEQEV